MKTLSKAVAIASMISAGVMASQAANAEVEVSASAAVSNMYLWRGTNLGAPKGIGAISGDLSVSMNGAYAGVWASSGDATYGNEYDLYAGYGMESGDFSADISVWTYVYPTGPDSSDTMFDTSDLVVSLGFADASVTLYEKITSNKDDTRYVTLGYGIDSVSALVGASMSDDAASDYTHVDISYAYNDNISFTFSQVVAQDVDDTVDEDGKVVVTYSLPL